MYAAHSSLDTLIRPRLLIVSARHGLSDYTRSTLLPRLLGLPIGRAMPQPKAALPQLLAKERGLEDARRHHDASWRAASHVAVLTAILHEAILIRQDAPDTMDIGCIDMTQRLRSASLRQR